MTNIRINHTSICFIGDIHGNFGSVLTYMQTSKASDALLVICGDIGFGFEKRGYYDTILNKFRKRCEERNIDVICIRGNHDDPRYFDGETINEKHFKCVKDYTVLQVYSNKDELEPYRTILCVGGAVSVDREIRKLRYSRYVAEIAQFRKISYESAKEYVNDTWWKDEMVDFNEKALKELKEYSISVDTIASHTCPSWAELRSDEGISGFKAHDAKLDGDLKEERSRIDMIYNMLKSEGHKVDLWCYGHFHHHIEEEIDGVKYIMLDMAIGNKLDSYIVKRY